MLDLTQIYYFLQMSDFLQMFDFLQMSNFPQKAAVLQMSSSWAIDDLSMVGRFWWSIARFQNAHLPRKSRFSQTCNFFRAFDANLSVHLLYMTSLVVCRKMTKTVFRSGTAPVLYLVFVYLLCIFPLPESPSCRITSSFKRKSRSNGVRTSTIHEKRRLRKCWLFNR